MAYDFPASPSVGTIYSPAGGPTWQWNGTTWLATAPSGLVPEAPADGQNYVRRNGVWVLAPGTAEAKNRIVNPAMQISQENGTTGVAVANYPADQWRFTGVSSSTLSSAQVKGTAGSDTPNYLAVNASPAETAAAATEYVFLEQVMEGVRISDFRWGVAQAQAAVVAFHVNVPVAGTYWVAAMNFAGTHTFLGSYTVSAGEISTWVRKSVAIPAGAINAGVWPVGNAGAVILRFPFHCGANFVGVAGFQAGGLIAGPGQALGLSTGSQCWLTNVGLYLDPQNTGIAPPWQMPDEAQELETCQRYWAKNFAADGSWNAATTSFRSVFPLKQPMRVVPAVTPITPAGAVEEYNVAFRDIGALGAFSFGSNFDCVNSMTLTTAAASAIGHAGSLGADRLIFNARM